MRPISSFIPAGAAKQAAINFLLITSGSVLVAVAINGALIPMGFASGGFIGLSMLVQHLFPLLPLGLVYLALNLPVYVMGFRQVGGRFFFYSLLGAIVLAAALEWVRPVLPLDDKIPAALVAGILSGLGSGLMLRSQGSAGGVDILSVILLRRYSIRLGSTILAFNVVVLLGVALLFSLQGAVYTLIYMFVTSQVMDLVVSGLSRRKAVLIISPRWREISKGILEMLRRGATLVPARGAYTGQTERLLYTVISLRQVPRLKELVRGVDPQAFVVVLDTAEVMGQGIGNQPHW
ncbi:MAG: YitT family protein [Desulfarculaceae bacterium]